MAARHGCKSYKYKSSKNHIKMSVSKRAKQFMPFAAITGLEEALRKKEEEFDKLIEGFEKLVKDANDSNV